MDFVAVRGVFWLTSLEFLIFYLNFFEILKFFLVEVLRAALSAANFLQSRAARAVLKSNLILAFVDAVWGGGAAALVQFLRSDHHLARGLSRHWKELRWPTLAKESTMRKFTVSFRMRILLQCLDGADICDEP